MPRGEHPNSRKNLRMAYDGKGGFDSESARRAKKKSDEAKAIYKSINEDLRERCTPEKIKKINDRLISMAEHGNLRAYELIRDGLGEKPVNKVELGTREQDMAKMDEILETLGMTDEQAEEISEV